LTWNDINSSQYSLKNWDTWRQYSGSWVGKQTVFRSTGGNERWLNDESVYWRQCCSKKDNQWTSTFRSYWGQCCSKTVSDLVNFSSNWWATLHLKGILLSSAKTWLWRLTYVIRWVHLNEHRKMNITKTDCGTIYSESQMRTSPREYGWWTSLRMPTHFLSWSDLTSWEESMEKNIELTTMSLLLQGMRCMSGRLDDFHEDWW
jgi:hypothetical protein